MNRHIAACAAPVKHTSEPKQTRALLPVQSAAGASALAVSYQQSRKASESMEKGQVLQRDLLTPHAMQCISR